MEWLTYLNELLHTPAGIGAIGGVLSAARVDYAAFRSWDEWTDVVSYSWRLASWRWFQGALIGALGVLGFDAVL